MGEQLVELGDTEPSNVVHVGDFSALKARRYLMEAYGVDLGVEDPGISEVTMVLGGIERFIPGTTHASRLRQTSYYATAAYSQALFFAQPGRKPPEHGDISF